MVYEGGSAMGIRDTVARSLMEASLEPTEKAVVVTVRFITKLRAERKENDRAPLC